MASQNRNDYLVSEGLRVLMDKKVDEKYLGTNHYITGSGTGKSGGETFHWIDGIVINTHTYTNKWHIIAYHGTSWSNLNSILEQGLQPFDPIDCSAVKNNEYGNGIYVSPYQEYAKEYTKNISTAEQLSNGKEEVYCVLGLRIRNSSCITKTRDPKIWVIRDPKDVCIQDINLSLNKCNRNDYLISEALRILEKLNVNKRYLSKNHYITGSGTGESGGETFHWSNGVVINTHTYTNKWHIIAYHGTSWSNLNSILEEGLQPFNPLSCMAFQVNMYGKGVYVSPYQEYAKKYAKDRGWPEKLTNGREKVYCVLGLRIRDSSCITKTSDPNIWVIRDPRDVCVQDINLSL